MSRPYRALAAAILIGAAMWPASIATAGGGCHRGASQGTGHTVRMVEACFTPSVLYVAPGTEVTFVNDETLLHNVGGTRWYSPPKMRKGDRFSAAFADEGVYPFACSYHTGMTGAVVVGDGMGAGSGESVRVAAIRDEVASGARTPERPDRRALGWGILAVVGGLLAGGVIGGLLRRPRSD